jgi:hypothetical protein
MAVSFLTSQMPCTLIADDQLDVLAALRVLLKGAGEVVQFARKAG